MFEDRCAVFVTYTWQHHASTFCLCHQL